MTIKQISVFVENKAGQLSNFVDVLSENDIDMRALSPVSYTHLDVYKRQGFP